MYKLVNHMEKIDRQDLVSLMEDSRKLSVQETLKSLIFLTGRWIFGMD
ncbi:hypothetical protein E2C01_056559 [Portunus trituberculatus]|uniref:Uncharacterized protein n=1 Tax=Portunus trituberculatus TaxID=210409 RepID=A0A5B7H0V8_PORTR|nr:hypothetical protein [Portunus trituberculatus]